MLRKFLFLSPRAWIVAIPLLFFGEDSARFVPMFERLVSHIPDEHSTSCNTMWCPPVGSWFLTPASLDISRYSMIHPPQVLVIGVMSKPEQAISVQEPPP